MSKIAVRREAKQTFKVPVDYCISKKLIIEEIVSKIAAQRAAKISFRLGT